MDRADGEGEYYSVGTGFTEGAVGTLRNHIRAMGGELEIVARFPDGEVHIQNFVTSINLPV